MSNDNCQKLKLDDALKRLPGPQGERSVALFEHGSLVVKLYAPRGSDPHARVVASSQPWACGDKLYLTRGAKAIELGTPPQHVDEIVAESDAVILYESDVSPAIAAKLANFQLVGVFRAPRARDVIVYRRVSGRTAAP